LTVDASEPPTTPLAAPSPRSRVLLADDDPVARELSRHMLEAAGVAPGSIELADDGHAALAAARRGGFSLIILDMCMPGQDGPAVARMIRGLDGLAEVPIVALTGNDSDEDRQRCLEAGMTEVLHKPISAAGMRALVARRLLARP
jgi:CheY-like chemotaxis protein